MISHDSSKSTETNRYFQLKFMTLKSIMEIWGE